MNKIKRFLVIFVMFALCFYTLGSSTTWGTVGGGYEGAPEPDPHNYNEMSTPESGETLDKPDDRTQETLPGGELNPGASDVTRDSLHKYEEASAETSLNLTVAGSCNGLYVTLASSNCAPSVRCWSGDESGSIGGGDMTYVFQNLNTPGAEYTCKATCQTGSKTSSTKNATIPSSCSGGSSGGASGCDYFHLNGCSSASDCTTAGGQWSGGVCGSTGCSSDKPTACITQFSCERAGGQWLGGGFCADRGGSSQDKTLVSEPEETGGTSGEDQTTSGSEGTWQSGGSGCSGFIWSGASDGMHCKDEGDCSKGGGDAVSCSNECCVDTGQSCCDVWGNVEGCCGSVQGAFDEAQAQFDWIWQNASDYLNVSSQVSKEGGVVRYITNAKNTSSADMSNVVLEIDPFATSEEDAFQNGSVILEIESIAADETVNLEFESPEKDAEGNEVSTATGYVKASTKDGAAIIAAQPIGTTFEMPTTAPRSGPGFWIIIITLSLGALGGLVYFGYKRKWWTKATFNKIFKVFKKG